MFKMWMLASWYCVYITDRVSTNQDRPNIDEDNPQFSQLRNGGVCQLRDYCATEANEAGQVTTLAAVPYGGCGAGKTTMWKFFGSPALLSLLLGFCQPSKELSQNLEWMFRPRILILKLILEQTKLSSSSPKRTRASFYEQSANKMTEIENFETPLQQCCLGISCGGPNKSPYLCTNTFNGCHIDGVKGKFQASAPTSTDKRNCWRSSSGLCPFANEGISCCVPNEYHPRGIREPEDTWD